MKYFKTILSYGFALTLALGLVLPLTGCTVEQTEEGNLPEVEVTEEGNLPKYDVDVADVEVGTEEKEITVPDIDVKTEKKKVPVPDIDVEMPDEDEEDDGSES